jgi:hypothetical protein
MDNGIGIAIHYFRPLIATHGTYILLVKDYGLDHFHNISDKLNTLRLLACGEIDHGLFL